MSSPDSELGRITLHFATLSLLAIGGVNSVLPAIHRQAVDVGGWLTGRQFAELFALAQITPGPNTLIVTLVGFHVAGPAGAVLATAAIVGPSSIVTYFAARAWQRYERARWRVVVQAALVPVALALIAASALVLTRAVDNTPAAALITAGTAFATFFSRLNPLWMFALAAVLGYFGLV